MGGAVVREGYVIGRGEDGLTMRERAAAEMLRAGLTQKQIAPRLGVSKQRVYQLVRSLEAKGVDLTPYEKEKTDAGD
jgi:transposase